VSAEVDVPDENERGSRPITNVPRQPVPRPRFVRRTIGLCWGVRAKYLPNRVTSSQGPARHSTNSPAGGPFGDRLGWQAGRPVQGGEHVETAAKIDAVAFDTTGTLTQGETQLTDVFVRETADGTLIDGSLLSLAAAVQARSDHWSCNIRAFHLARRSENVR